MSARNSSSERVLEALRTAYTVHNITSPYMLTEEQVERDLACLEHRFADVPVREYVRFTIQGILRHMREHRIFTQKLERQFAYKFVQAHPVLRDEQSELKINRTLAFLPPAAWKS